ncbi:MAG: histidine kinase [Pleurocapsa sp. SU_5_0]|nr:histidine kinase [Pleurocapsa sp. SU_5_0]NJO95598.1 histidine kinase [Pleurocapsa sp. CRU_1_2]NJR46424.1 histidine kinase [Hyellaceae cyanobacterium CSU_1_1]
MLPKFDLNDNSNTTVSASKIEWQHLGAELVFTQDLAGNYLSFWWAKAAEYGLNYNQLKKPSHGQLDSQDIDAHISKVFAPVDNYAYLEKVRRVIKRRLPEQCYCLFQYQDFSYSFELIISPILPPQGEPQAVMVMGHLLRETEMFSFAQNEVPAAIYSYQKLLNQVVQQIRRSLDLATIYQHTVQNIGTTFATSRCLILANHYNHYNITRLSVKAEYCRDEYDSTTKYQINWYKETHLQQALESSYPLAVDFIGEDLLQRKSVLVISTNSSSQDNVLICLQQCDRYRHWTTAEMEMLREIAEQVEAAISLAKLYREVEQASIQAEEASRLKSDFLANTSHELRTPLNGIIGFLKLLLEGMADDPEEQREFIEEAYKSSIHLLNLINDILDIAKIEAGKMELELNEIELDELFQDVDNLINTQAKQKNLNFQIKSPATLTPVILYGNYQRLLQIMLNLISNGIKFTKEGGIVVSAEVTNKKIECQGIEFPGMVKISVADTGIGVSLEKQDKLFENFYQVDGSRTKSYGGTGLGLAISQKLVEAMGGTISFYSMGDGLGSTVTFTVPLSHLPVIKTAQS